MKAIQFSQFGGPDVLQYVDVPRPIPQDDEVLLDVALAGVQLRDVRERAGVYQNEEARLPGVALPRIPGFQVVGTVSQVGIKVDPGLLGQRVIALLHKAGGYAQHAVTRPAFTFLVPANAEETEMAALAQGLAAWLMLKASTELRRGESVLVHGGAGGVGSFAIQIAKALGAGFVVATAGSQEKREFVRSLGADVAIDYEDAGWPQAVLDCTDGRGVDVILESIGDDFLEQDCRCLATRGRLILFGSSRGPHRPFPPRQLMARSQTLTGFFGGSFLGNTVLLQEALEFLVQHALDGTVRPKIAQTLPLSKAAEAHRLLEDRRVKGAIILDARL